MAQIKNKNRIYVYYSHRDDERRQHFTNLLSQFLNALLGGDWRIMLNDVDFVPSLWHPLPEDSTEPTVALILLSNNLFGSENFPELDREILDKVPKASVISVILEGSKWGQHPRIFRSQVFPSDFEPFFSRSEVEHLEVAKNIAEAIAAVLGSGVSPEADEQTFSGEDPEEPGLVPLSRLKEFYLSPNVKRIFARLIFSRPVPVSSSAILFSMIVEGQGPSTTVNTSRFLANFMMKRAEKEYYPVFDKYLESIGVSEPDFNRKVSEITQKQIESLARSMTPVVYETLQKAKQFSEQISGRGQIHLGHLLGSLINKAAGEEKIGFQIRLEEMYIPLDVLQKEFLAFALKNHKGSPEQWEKFLFNKPDGPKMRVSRLAGFNADDASGDEDWLQIDDDVNAFATLIASRTVSPPLSIGLFGEWGSGKTFFMRRLRKRVDELTRRAQGSGKMQRDIPSYKRIAQIEFNAWHYVESNLWASLVEHIFDNLKITGADDDSQSIQTDLLNALNFEKAAEAKATEKVNTAKEELERSENALTAARDKLDKDHSTLESVKTRDILSTLKLPIQTENAIKDLAEKMNITPAGDGARDLIAVLNEAKVLLERGAPLLRFLFMSKDKGKRLFWLGVCLLAAPVAVLVVLWAREALNWQWVTNVVAIIGGVATFLGSMAVWLRKYIGMFSEWLSTAEQAKQGIEKKVGESQAELRGEIAQAEKKVDISNAELDSALREKEAAKQRVADAQAELKEASAENRLARFIQDRAASEDYRKHLGVLALIRDDFERLSRHIEDQNRLLMPEDLLAEPGSPGSQRFADLNAENADIALRINRIVLYIDDLDRCPPNKVVDVLQAVHLLLAFPLFVVVVGVDARWVARSLKARYQQLLHNPSNRGNNDNEKTGDDNEQVLIGAAKPSDYLEKIFQIPFWLNPMDKDARNRMVSGLLKGDLAKPDVKAEDNAPTGGNGNSPEAETKSDKNAAPDTAEVKTTRRKAAKSAPAGQSSTAGTGPAGEQPPASAREKTDPLAEDLLAQQKLEILPEEIEFIGTLTPLLGRSPRALKRFANVYRLVKVGLSEEELESFNHVRDGLADSHAVLFLLAVDTGIPAVSDDLFQYFRDISFGNLKTPVMPALAAEKKVEPFEWLLSHFHEGDPGWSEIKVWLEEPDRSGWQSEGSLKRIGGWVSRVARYSFQARKA